MNKKMFRNTAITTMAATATVAAVAPAVSADENKFSDVTQDNVHYDSIMALAEQGAVDGNLDGEFEPFKEVKRAQAAAILADVLDLEPSNVEKTLEQYNDVDASDDHAKAIAALTEEGIFSGDTDGNFNSWSEVNREQMAKVLVEAFNLNEYDDGEDVELNTDVISSEFTGYVQTLANLGITKNASDYDSWTYVNRDTFSSFVVRSQEVVEENAAPEVESVSAINATQIEVTFDNGETATVDLEEELADGENEVTFTYNGEEYTETVNYDAPDTEAPVLNVDGETTVSVENGAELTLPEVTATDNEDESVEVTSVITDSEGNEIEGIDTTVAGTYTVTYSAEDAAGNVAEDVVVTVEVAEAPDTEAPQVTVDGLEDESTVYESSVTFSTEATDNEDEDVAPVVTVGENEVEANEDGTYTVELEEGENTITVDAVDEAGNTAETQTFSVTFDASVVNAETAVEDFEASVDTVEDVEELVNDGEKLQEVMASYVPATNAVQKVSGDEKEVLQERLDSANDVVTAASFVDSLQSATEELTEDNLEDAQISLTSAEGSVSTLADGDVKDALTALVDAEEEKIDAFATELEATTAVEVYEEAPLTSADEVIAAEALGETAVEAVANVSDEEAKAALAERVEAKDEAVTDAREAEEDAAIELINSSTVFNIVERLEAPILALEGVNPEYKEDYQDERETNFSRTKEEIQNNVIDYVQNEKDNDEEEKQEEIANAIETLNGAIDDYNSAINEQEQNDASATITQVLANSEEGEPGLELDNYVETNSELYVNAFVEADSVSDFAAVQSLIQSVNEEVQLNEEVDAVTETVGDLFENVEADELQLGENVGQDDIDAAQDEVTDLAELDYDTTELQGLVDTAEELQEEKDYNNAVEDAEDAVNDLVTVDLVTEEDYNNHSSQDDIDNAQEEVDEAAELGFDATDLNAEIYVAQVTLNTANAKEAVNNLFQNDTEESDELTLAGETTQENIDDAKESAESLPNEVKIKGELEAKAEQAQVLLDERNAQEAFEAAQADVEALTNTDSEETALADGITQEDITDAKEAVEALVDSDDKEGLLEDVQVAQDSLVDNVTNTVESLTTTTEDDETVLADDVTQDGITNAKEAVEALVDSVEEKEALLEDVQVAQDILHANNLEAATNAVEGLTDSEGNLADGTNQQAIDDAQGLVDEYDGDEDEDTSDLQSAIDDAQDQLDTANINEAADDEALEDLLVELDEDSYNNLSSAQRLEVAATFLGVIEESDFETTEQITVALQSTVDTYETQLADVNAATTISETDVALEALDVEEYNNLSSSEQLVQAENVLNDQPENGYTTVAEIVAEFEITQE